MPGIAHLVRRLGHGVILPLALEYPFWEERYPEAIASFGEPIRISQESSLRVSEWLTRIGTALAATQDALAREAQRRRPEAFDTLADGRPGVGGMYGLCGRFKALAAGKRFKPEHGSGPAPAAVGSAS